MKINDETRINLLRHNTRVLYMISLYHFIMLLCLRKNRTDLPGILLVTDLIKTMNDRRGVCKNELRMHSRLQAFDLDSKYNTLK